MNIKIPTKYDETVITEFNDYIITIKKIYGGHDRFNLKYEIKHNNEIIESFIKTIQGGKFYREDMHFFIKRIEEICKK